VAGVFAFQRLGISMPIIDQRQWETCDSPLLMLRHLAPIKRLGTPRKRRLLQCAWCRDILSLTPDPLFVQAVNLMELHVDGGASRAEVRDMFGKLGQKLNDLQTEAYKNKRFDDGGMWPLDCQVAYAFYTLFCPVRDINQCFHACARIKTINTERIPQADLVREIFPNPFRKVHLAPAWLTWKDLTVVQIAQAFYDQPEHMALLVLADALEEAGCTLADVLGHLRGQFPHVRGCWVIDLILGKA